MNTPTELYYSKDPIWAKDEDNQVRLGITDYAQTTLGEIVFLDLPEEGNSLTIENSPEYVNESLMIKDGCWKFKWIL